MRGHPLPHIHFSALTEKHVADAATKSCISEFSLGRCLRFGGKKLELVFLGGGARGGGALCKVTWEMILLPHCENTSSRDDDQKNTFTIISFWQDPS